MIEQGTAEWHAQRCGKVTASRVADLRAKTKSGWGASRANYMAQLIAERLTGTVAESYSNAAMQWGTDTEAEARDAYAFLHADGPVERVGFVDHPRLPMCGASPDGLVGNYALVEIKCPNTATHIDWLLSAQVPDRYVMQMQWQLACTGRQWCDFVSYDPRMPDNMKLFVRRLDRDDDIIADIEADIILFQAQLEIKLDQLRQLYPLVA